MKDFEYDHVAAKLASQRSDVTLAYYDAKRGFAVHIGTTPLFNMTSDASFVTYTLSIFTSNEAKIEAVRQAALTVLHEFNLVKPEGIDSAKVFIGSNPKPAAGFDLEYQGYLSVKLTEQNIEAARRGANHAAD